MSLFKCVIIVQAWIFRPYLFVQLNPKKRRWPRMNPISCSKWKRLLHQSLLHQGLWWPKANYSIWSMVSPDNQNNPVNVFFCFSHWYSGSQLHFSFIRFSTEDTPAEVIYFLHYGYSLKLKFEQSSITTPIEAKFIFVAACVTYNVVVRAQNEELAKYILPRTTYVYYQVLVQSNKLKKTKTRVGKRKKLEFSSKGL